MFNVFNKNNFINILIILTLIKVCFAFFFPVNPDEAYYILWSKNLSLGYYDHPPMIAWLIKVVSYIDIDILTVRSISILSSFASLFFVYYFSQLINEESAFAITLIYALSPLYLLYFPLTNDGPLLLFSIISIYFYYRSLKNENHYSFILCGIFLGLAFLSKYLVFPIFIGIFIFNFFIIKKNNLKFIIFFSIGFLPFLSQHIYYNYNNCWDTLNFHIFNRNEGSGLSLQSLASFFVGMPLILTPWIIYGIYKYKPKDYKIQYRLLLTISLTIIVIYFFISLKSIIGMQFYLLLGSFIFPLFASVKKEQIKIYLFLSSGYSIILILLVIILINFPLNKFVHSPHYLTFVMRSEPRFYCDKFNEYKDYEIYTDYYATAALLSYVCEKDIKVIFGKSRYGREYDKWMNYQNIENKIFYFKIWGDIEEEKSYFGSYKLDLISIRNKPLKILLGENFDIIKYKKEFLEKIKKDYYSIPKWIPQKKCEIF